MAGRRRRALPQLDRQRARPIAATTGEIGIEIAPLVEAGSADADLAGLIDS
jgi:hypothetical protein